MSPENRENAPIEDHTASDNAPFERVKLARHAERPHSLDYISRIIDDFVELHGDRRYADDAAIVGGMGVFDLQEVIVIGHQKGRDTKQTLKRNFGMPKPEGYRKALRLMSMAEKFNRPVITLIDTPGAYPGIDAEERGQSEAIAFNLREMARLKVPVVVTIIGEGGSGGALAIGVGDYVLMLENAVYSVITPEGCAAILWKEEAAESDGRQKVVARAAECLRLTAQDLVQQGIIDEIVPEPPGGAHTSYDEAAKFLSLALKDALNVARQTESTARLARRYERLRKLGDWRV